MCRQASSVFWLLSGDLFSDAEWSSRVVTAHFFCSALCHPRACAAVSASHIFIWRSTWTDQGAHREGCWFCICLACPKSHSILALLHKEGVLCIICKVACPDAIKWVTSPARSAMAQPSAPVLLAFFTVLCWGGACFFFQEGGGISKGGHVSSFERGGPLAWEVHWHGGGGV